MTDGGGGVTIAKSRPEYFMYEARKQLGKPLKVLDGAGEQMSFYGRTLAWMPKTLVHYTREVLRLLAEVAFGSGGLAVIGGSIGVMVLMSASPASSSVCRATRPSTGWIRGPQRLPVGLRQHP